MFDGPPQSVHMMTFKHNNFSNMMFNAMHSKHQSLIEPRRADFFGDNNEQPPPLPVKKKHSKFQPFPNHFFSHFCGESLS